MTVALGPLRSAFSSLLGPAQPYTIAPDKTVFPDLV
jgi:hypothetical protein